MWERRGESHKMIKQIVFVYNADAGVLAAVWDSAKKLTSSPNACALCVITHGVFSEKDDWRVIEANLGFPTAYFYRNEIPQALQDFLGEKGLSLPLVLLEMEDASYAVAVAGEGLKNCAGDPNCLKEKLAAALNNFIESG